MEFGVDQLFYGLIRFGDKVGSCNGWMLLENIKNHKESNKVYYAIILSLLIIKTREDDHFNRTELRPTQNFNAKSQVITSPIPKLLYVSPPILF